MLMSVTDSQVVSIDDREGRKRAPQNEVRAPLGGRPTDFVAIGSWELITDDRQ